MKKRLGRPQKHSQVYVKNVRALRENFPLYIKALRGNFILYIWALRENFFNILWEPCPIYLGTTYENQTKH